MGGDGRAALYELPTTVAQPLFLASAWRNKKASNAAVAGFFDSWQRLWSKRCSRGWL